MARRGTKGSDTNNPSLAHLVRSVPQQKLSLVLVQPARVSAYYPATEVHLGAREGQGGPKPRRRYGDAQMLGPVRRNAFQRQWKLK